MTQNDVMQLFIGKDVGAATPTTAVNGYISDYSKLVDGEMAVVNSHNKVLSATSVLTDDIVAESGIKVIMRNGTDIIQSDLIKQANILAFKTQVDVAAAEQVSYIGYNGTSNSIEVVNSKLYVVRIELKEQDVTGFGQQRILNAPYKSDASATQLEVALGLVQQLSRMLRRQTPQAPIQAELVCNLAYFATAAIAHAVTFVKGEQYISVATNTDYNTNVDLAVGDYVRLSDAPATTGCLVTDGIYKVTELTSTTVFKVDRPIEEESFSAVAAAKASATVLTAAKMATANLGIKLSGVAKSFTVGKFPYSKVSFLVGLDSAASFGGTVVTYSTAMSLGQGNYEQIAELEWNLLGNDGNPYPSDFMWTAARACATSGKTYDQISITHFGDHSTGGVGATPRRQKQLLLAFETGFSNGEAPDIISDILAAFATQASTIGV
jgi:hypothetical protein